MRRSAPLLAGFIVVAAACGAGVQNLALKPFDLGAYLSFIANWTPDTAPFCAVLRSAADWSAVLRPAAVMGSAKPFAPPADFWSANGVLVLT